MFLSCHPVSPVISVCALLGFAAWGQWLRCDHVPPSPGLPLAMWHLPSHRSHPGPGFAIKKPEEEISEQEIPAVKTGGLGVGRPQLRSQWLTLLAADLGQVTQPLPPLPPRPRLSKMLAHRAAVYFPDLEG